MCLLFARTGASLLLYTVRICVLDISFIEPSFVGIYIFTHNYRVLIFPFDTADIQSIFCVYFSHALVPCFYTVRIFPFDKSFIESLFVCVLSSYFPRWCLVFLLHGEDIFFCNIIYL